MKTTLFAMFGAASIAAASPPFATSSEISGLAFTKDAGKPLRVEVIRVSQYMNNPTGFRIIFAYVKESIPDITVEKFIRELRKGRVYSVAKPVSPGSKKKKPVDVQWK